MQIFCNYPLNNYPLVLQELELSFLSADHVVNVAFINGRYATQPSTIKKLNIHSLYGTRNTDLNPNTNLFFYNLRKN